MPQHPGAAYTPTAVEDEFDSYADVGQVDIEEGKELYVAIGDDEYLIDQRRVNDLEIASLTTVISNLIKLTQTSGTIEEVDELQWRATLIVCRMCPDIPESVASCNVVHYKSSEDDALKGVSYRGRILYMTLEEMVIMMGMAMKAYHQNRPKRISDFVAYNSDRIDDDQLRRLQGVIEADKERAEQLNTDFTQNIIDGYLEYARQIEGDKRVDTVTNEAMQAATPTTRKRTAPVPQTQLNRRTKKRSRGQ